VVVFAHHVLGRKFEEFRASQTGNCFDFSGFLVRVFWSFLFDFSGISGRYNFCVCGGNLHNEFFSFDAILFFPKIFWRENKKMKFFEKICINLRIFLLFS
jgi:hypothetical protein